MSKQVATTIAMDCEEFLSRNGVGISAIGDSGLHMRGRHQTDAMWMRLVNAQAARDRAVGSRRITLRDEYSALVDEGQIRPLTRRERLERTAAGHPDNPSVQAARRLLAVD